MSHASQTARESSGFDELVLDPKTFGLMGEQLTLGQPRAPRPAR